MFSHLFSFFFFTVFKDVLYFSDYKFYASFVKFTVKYSSFYSIVNGIVLLKFILRLFICSCSTIQKYICQILDTELLKLLEVPECPLIRVFSVIHNESLLITSDFMVMR